MSYSNGRKRGASNKQTSYWTMSKKRHFLKDCDNLDFSGCFAIISLLCFPSVNGRLTALKIYTRCPFKDITLLQKTGLEHILPPYRGFRFSLPGTEILQQLPLLGIPAG